MAVNTTLAIGITLGCLAFLITGVAILICVKKRGCRCCRSQGRDNTHSKTCGGQEICELEAGNLEQNVTQCQKVSGSASRSMRPKSERQNSYKETVSNILGERKIITSPNFIQNQGFEVDFPSYNEILKRTHDTQNGYYKQDNKLNQNFHGLNIDGTHRKKRQPKVHYYKPGWTEVTAKQAMNLARDVFVKNWDSSREILKNPKKNSEATGTYPFNTGSKPNFVKVSEDDTRGWVTKDSLQEQWKNMSHYSFDIPSNYKFRASESTSNPNQINLKIARPYRKDNFQSFYNYHLNCFYPSQLEHEYV